jgi:hypothetical protein
MTASRDAVIAIFALAEEQNPGWPAAYLLGVAVSALQEEGATLAEIQAWAEQVFNTPADEAIALARARAMPPEEPS